MRVTDKKRIGFVDTNGWVGEENGLRPTANGFPSFRIRARDDGIGPDIRVKDGVISPLAGREIRFAAWKQHDQPYGGLKIAQTDSHGNDELRGLVSVPLSVVAEANGEVYVVGRSYLGDWKASLHASGDAHVKQERGERRSESICKWTWKHDLPCLHMLFLPTFGASVAPAETEKKLWGRNHFLLGIDDEWGMCVSLMRTRPGIEALEPPPFPAHVLGRRQMRTGEILWVVAHGIHPPCDARSLDQAIGSIPLPDLGKQEGEVLDMMLGGPWGNEAAFVVPLRVEVRRAA